MTCPILLLIGVGINTSLRTKHHICADITWSSPSVVSLSMESSSSSSSSTSTSCMIINAMGKVHTCKVNTALRIHRLILIFPFHTIQSSILGKYYNLLVLWPLYSGWHLHVDKLHIHTTEWRQPSLCDIISSKQKKILVCTLIDSKPEATTLWK